MNQNNIEKIIKKQEREWDDKVYAIPYAGQKYKKDIKEILEGVKQHVSEMGYGNRNSGLAIGYQHCISDTIKYLEEVIKKLD